MTYELRPPEGVNLAGIPTGRDHLSNTSLGTFLNCEQKFAWHYEHHLQPVVTATPLAMGRAFAHALEHADPDAGYQYLCVEAQKEADRADTSPWLTAPNPTDTEIQATIVREAARAYLNAYGTHNTREVEMRARIRNPRLGGRYSATHDLLCRADAVSIDSQTLYEDKLVGQIPRASLAAKIRLDRQVSIECYLHWRTTGRKIEQVRYRMTLKPAIRQRNNETLPSYLERIADEYATRPDHYLAEEIANRTESDFLRLEQELWRWAEQIRDARRDGIWPRNTSVCHDRGLCAFIPLCAQEPGAANQFVKREERPLEAHAA